MSEQVRITYLQKQMKEAKRKEKESIVWVCIGIVGIGVAVAVYGFWGVIWAWLGVAISFVVLLAGMYQGGKAMQRYDELASQGNMRRGSVDPESKKI